MKNKDQLKHDQETLHADAMKDLIRETLKSGPGFAKDLATRAGVPHGREFVRALHEMEDDMQVSFTWLRGYKL